MSETFSLPDPADIGERLRSAAEFEPRNLPRLTHMGEAWAAAGADRLNEIAGAPLDVALLEVDTDFAPEAEGEEAATELFAVLSSPRFRTPGYLTVRRAGLDAMIAAFFAAEPTVTAETPREPTDLDRSIVKLAMATVAEAAGPVFEAIADLKLTAGDLIDPSELMAQLGEGSERFVLFRFELRVERITAPFTFAFPASVLAPHRRFLRKAPDAPARDRDESWSDAIKASFAQSDLRMEAVLAKKKVPLRMIAGFKVGDTFPLEVGADSLIAVACEDRPLFRARMGRSRETYVLRIEERIDPAEEFIDDILSD